MEVSRALDQIAEIRDHLARTETYRGSRSAQVAFSGLLAVAGWLVQPWAIPEASARAFVAYWVTIAAASVAVVMVDLGWSYFRRADAAARRMTRKVLGQFCPCLAAGGAVTGAIALAAPGSVPLLPGLWAVLLGLGLFSTRPYLPRAIGWVALFYLCAGILLIARSGGTPVPESWGMGATFGVGQLLAGLVLYWNVERREDV